MRPKEPRLVVTFATTTHAFAMEDAGKACGLKGRIIPVPRQITAGCGLSWSEPAENGEHLKKVLRERQLHYENIYELVI